MSLSHRKPNSLYRLLTLRFLQPLLLATVYVNVVSFHFSVYRLFFIIFSFVLFVSFTLQDELFHLFRN